MIEMRRAQLKFGDHWVAEEVADLRENWMIHADQILDDEIIVAAVYEALGKRHPKSRSRGRYGAPAEMVLRLLVLKHVRNWSYQVLEREVRANLVYRDFARIGGGKMPDAKTMGRWGVLNRIGTYLALAALALQLVLSFGHVHFDRTTLASFAAPGISHAKAAAQASG